MIKLSTNLFRQLIWRHLSLRALKVIIAGVLVCVVVAFLTLWQPAYLRLRSLQEDKTHWQDVLTKGVKKSNIVIPAMDRLPDMIELCRSAFVDQGGEVVSFNVERFGERRETGKVARLDYALVRLRLVGPWEGIVTSLAALEKMQEVSIHVQEVILGEEGGEVLLKIFYCTGE